MPTGLGSRPTFSCSHPRSSRDISCVRQSRIVDRASLTAAARPPISAIPDARIKPPGAEVKEHVHAHEDHGVEQDQVLDDDDVALDHRGDERAAEAGYAERLLDGDRAA